MRAWCRPGFATAAVLALAGIVSCAGGGGDATDPAGRLVERLQADPGLAPPEVAPGAEVVLVEVGVEGTTVVLPRPPLPQPGANLRLERALARRRTGVPALWAVVTAPDGSEVRYWCATTDQAEIRSTVRDPSEGKHRGGRSMPKGAATSIRVPFEPRGQLRFYRASGGALATYRFGDSPREALVRVES